MENKGKQKYNPRDDMSLDQAILQWIVDDYDIPDEKSRKIVGESGKKSKLITCKMVMDYLDNRGVVEETDETEFMRALRKRLYYAIVRMWTMNSIINLVYVGIRISTIAS